MLSLFHDVHFAAEPQACVLGSINKQHWPSSCFRSFQGSKAAMANPPRPWLRLASIRAVPAPVPVPVPAPAPHTQPTQPREPPPPPPQPQPPRFALDVRTSAPSSPSHKVPPPPPPPPHSSSSSSPPPPPASPHQKATITTSSSSPTRKASTSSPSSPKTIKQAVESPEFPTSPTQSPPKIKTSVPPPSPLTLPPSSLNTTETNNIPAEAEPKTVLVEMTVDKPRQWPNATGEFHRETGESRNNHASSRNGKLVAGKESETNKEKGNHKKLSDSEDSGMRVITIAGENRGAYMELIQSQKKHEPNRNLHKINGISKDKSDGGGESESSSSGEGNKNKNKNRGRGASTSSFPMAAYMNSNVQCVNNSLLFNASCSHHDPGVRLSLSKKPFGEGYHLKERVEGHNV